MNKRWSYYFKNKAVAHAQSAVVMLVLYAITGAIFFGAMEYAYREMDSLGVLRVVIFCLLIPLFLKMAVQLIAAPLYSVIDPLRYARRQSKALPRVSVLIPAWNEEVGIIKTIESVVRARYANFELVVVNDGSTDKTHQLVTDYIAQHKTHAGRKGHPPIHYVKLKNGGKARAMNRALALASGEIIMTIDADSVMDAQAIRKMVDRFSDDKVAAVAGNVIVGNRNKPLELIQQLEYLYGFFFKRADDVFKSVYIIGGAAAAYRKSALETVGGFDESIITEDIELSVRLLNHGFATRYAADAVVYTEGPADWSGLCRQRLRWKFGRLQTFFKHSNLFFSRQAPHNPYLTVFLLPLAVYSEILLLLEGPLLLFFYGYTLLTFDFLPLVFLVLFLTSIITIQVMLDSKARFHLNLLTMAPISWLLFYVVDVVEFQALLRSLKRLATRQELQWQKWQRAGITSSSLQ
ncbi:MAG: glycosyltransferase [Gammaproteobacteria bacterium]|nr:glycosyltransferase [Gammaproteobacteria bacterium]